MSDRRAYSLAFPRYTLSLEQLVLATSLFWAVALNRPFLIAALRGQSWSELSSWSLAAALVVGVVALHALLLGLVAARRLVKPVVALLTLVGAFAVHYMGLYGVVIDPSMVRNALNTDLAETRELLSWNLALDLLLYGVVPIALLASAQIEPRSWGRALKARLLLLVGALGVLLAALMWQYQPLASLMRNHKEVRYLVTPANSVWSLGTVLAADARGAAQPRQAIGLDASPGPGRAAQTRPRLVVFVVGETARAANWGLSGYARQTTPQLATLPVVNFGDVTACGTSTEVSLPCMFAPVGRRDYDESRIRRSESLLHVVARADVAVHWRDNQSGCKGVCEGLSRDTVNASLAPGLCQGDRCWDEGLLRGLEERLGALAQGRSTQLLVLHMLGNHGPSYYRRYPAAFERFRPACQNDDLSRCTREEIVNAYDNALLYTDHVLATLVRTLDASADKVDSAMVFVSDHGESLGEKNLFLHGVPYAIAPLEQLKVPMVMWVSPGFGRATGVTTDCLQALARAPVQHDHLFHTLLGLLDTRTALHEPAFDLTHGCRKAAAAP